MGEPNRGSWLQKTGITVFVAAVAVFLSPKHAIASEEIIFTYGGASQSVDLEELQVFAETGETSPALDFLLEFGQHNPWMMRWILTQEFPANTKIVSDLFNTAPGEYVLSQTSNVVGSKSERANVTALRGALIASASDDNTISLIELFENYPTKQVYVNGKLLAKARVDLDQFVEETSKYIQVPRELFNR